MHKITSSQDLAKGKACLFSFRLVPQLSLPQKLQTWAHKFACRTNFEHTSRLLSTALGKPGLIWHWSQLAWGRNSILWGQNQRRTDTRFFSPFFPWRFSLLLNNPEEEEEENSIHVINIKKACSFLLRFIFVFFILWWSNQTERFIKETLFPLVSACLNGFKRNAFKDSSAKKLC